MFRLNKTVGEARTTVTIDGELSADYVEVVETCCGQARADGKPIDLVLNDVSTVDEAGRALLCRLAASGVRLSGHGVYISYLVRSVSPAAKR